MDERISSMIRDYICDLHDPKYYWHAEDFEFISYSKWASKELLVYLLRNQDIDVRENISNFKLKLSRMHKANPKYGYMAEVGIKVADNIDDIIVAMGY